MHAVINYHRRYRIIYTGVVMLIARWFDELIAPHKNLPRKKAQYSYKLIIMYFVMYLSILMALAHVYYDVGKYII